MKITVTINLGNYENVYIESSEHPAAGECINEIKAATDLFRPPQVHDYMERVFGVL